MSMPRVWALGFNGTDIVVGEQDTGVRWTHNALKPHYRGWNGSAANHNYNWSTRSTPAAESARPTTRSRATTPSTAHT